MARSRAILLLRWSRRESDGAPGRQWTVEQRPSDGLPDLPGFSQQGRPLPAGRCTEGVLEAGHGARPAGIG
jgi:hypothetical protein